MAERSAPPDAFGNTAEEYERGRPEWPEQLLDVVVDDLGLAADAVVLDLGAGTGKLTRSLVPRFERVIAVEPDDQMCAVLKRVVPDAEPLAGSAEAIPVGGASVDAVFSGEAFHWFATDETVAQVARILRPGGALAIFWNIYEGHMEPQLSDKAETVLDEAFRRGGAPGQARVLSGEWRSPLERSPFGPLKEHELQREIVSDREGWLANVLSVSSIAALPEAARTALAERLRELTPEGEYRRKFRTLAYWTRLGA